jgi:hypothetical protein
VYWTGRATRGWVLAQGYSYDGTKSLSLPTTQVRREMEQCCDEQHKNPSIPTHLCKCSSPASFLPTSASFPGAPRGDDDMNTESEVGFSTEALTPKAQAPSASFHGASRDERCTGQGFLVLVLRRQLSREAYKRKRLDASRPHQFFILTGGFKSNRNHEKNSTQISKENIGFPRVPTW